MINAGISSSLGAGLGIAAAVLSMSAFLVYIRDILKGAIVPNRASWIVWEVVILTGAASYSVSTGDWAKSLIALTDVAICSATCVLVLARHKGGSFGTTDKLALGFTTLAMIAWATLGSATVANILVQCAGLLGFGPTILSVWRVPQHEQPLAWWLWTAGYGALFATVLLRWDGQPWNLVYPGLGVLFHPIVAILATRKSTALGGAMEYKTGIVV